MLEFTTVPVEWKADAEDPGILLAYASVFGNVDNQGDVVMKGAFAKTIRERVPKGEVPLIDTHGIGTFGIPTTKDVIGTVVAAKEDETGLLIKARFASTPDAQAVRTKAMEGHLGRMSIGYQPIRFRFEDRKVDGADQMVRVLEELKLGEVSIVPLPANEEAAILSVKSAVGALEGEGWTYEGRSSFAAQLDRLRETIETKWDAEVGKAAEADETKAADDQDSGQTDDETKADADETSDKAEGADEAKWDGPAALRRCKTASDFRSIAFEAQNDSAPDSQEHWVLPHHNTPDGPADPGGVSAALGRLDQTGPTVLSKDAIRSHLEGHQSKADETPLNVKEWLRRSQALLEGRDPGVLADPGKVAYASMQMEILEREIAEAERSLTAKAAVAELVAKGERLTAEDLKNLADRMEGEADRPESEEGHAAA